MDVNNTSLSPPVIGNDVSLTAKSNVRLGAGEITSITTTENKFSSASIGASFAPSGLTDISISANKGNGDSKESVTSYSPALVSAQNDLTLTSGKDMDIIGSKAQGEKITAKVGGSLNIETLQEKETYEEDNHSTGFGVSWNVNQTKKETTDANGDTKIETLRSFSKPTFSGSWNKGNIDSHYRSARDQAGFFGGSKGFDIYVEKNTDLKGGVIASNAAPDKNHLSTGTLSFSDLKNEADYSAKSIGASYHKYGNYKNMTEDEQNKVYNTIGLAPNISMPVKGDASSTTKSAVAAGTIDIRENPAQDISSLSRNTANSLNELGRIFDKAKIEEQQELAVVFGEEAFRLAHNLKDDGSGRKIAIHIAIGGIMSAITGASFASGAVGAGLNEALIKNLKGLDPGTAQIVSGIIGVAAAKAIGGNAVAGASAAAIGTKWNYLAEGHTPVQIGISIKDGGLGHVGIVVKTDTGSYDSADYGRYGEDVEKSSSGFEAPTGHGTFITRWFYDPDEKYTFMINPEYIDPVKAVAAYNDQIKNNGYTQIPMEETANFFREVRLKDGNSEEVKEQNEHAKEINANTQYYRNYTSDYDLTEYNCATTTILPILQSISFEKLSPEAKSTFSQIMDNLYNPRALHNILIDDIVFFMGKGLFAKAAYGEVPSE